MAVISRNCFVGLSRRHLSVSIRLCVNVNKPILEAETQPEAASCHLRLFGPSFFEQPVKKKRRLRKEGPKMATDDFTCDLCGRACAPRVGLFT